MLAEGRRSGERRMSWIISTVTGTGQAGYSGDGGPATEACLNNPFDVAFDRAGNLYFSDTFNHCIRRVDANTGVIGTVAGNGEAGYSGDGGRATEARLNEPYGIVLDASGNLYFADRLNRRVRRVDTRGVITTVAGTGEPVSDGDGRPADRAGLAEPNGLALDPAGARLFIADVAAHRVRVVDLARGMIATFAGSGEPRHDGDGGPAAQAGIFGARAVQVAPDGTVYILERQGSTLRAVNARSGVIRTVAGTGARGYDGDGGEAVAATFNAPKEFAVDAEGNLLIVETENHVIRRIDARTRIVTTIAGNGGHGGEGDGGPATQAGLARPHGVAVGPDGAIYIGDTENHRIRKLTAS
ncbi:MAG: hypothetical protein J0H14_00420 [Alphaproteobacteria bacterium]|nr:hypothetical protein [Alphaproteobacteria bacterium]